MLSVNDLARCSAVSRGWKSTADKIRESGAFPGVNAGFLYQLTDSRLNRGYLYISQRNNHTADVLTTNPLLRSVFEKSQTVAFIENLNLGQKTPDAYIEAIEKFHSDFLGKFSTEQIQGRLQEIYAFLSKKRTPAEFARFRAMARKMPDDAMELMLAFVFCCSELGSIQKFNPEHLLYKKSGRKACLLGTIEDDEIVIGKGLARLAEILQHDDGTILEAFSRRLGLEKAWFLGHADFKGLEMAEEVVQQKPRLNWHDGEILDAYILEYETLVKSINPQNIREVKEKIDGISEKIKSILEHQSEKFNRASQETAQLRQVLKDQEDRFEYLARMSKQRSAKQAEKIASVLDRSLLVIGNNSNVISSLKALGIGVHGPLKVPIKPVGLLWQLTAPNGNWGYLCGSIHIIPPQLLDFNQQMLSCFGVCQTLALETDITREDVIKVEDAQRKARGEAILSRFTPQEQKKLAVIFKKFLSLSRFERIDCRRRKKNFSRRPFLLSIVCSSKPQG